MKKAILSLTAFLCSTCIVQAEDIVNAKSYLERNSYGRTKLMVATRNNDLLEVARLIELGVDVNATDFDGNNAYCYAYANKGLEVAQALKEAGSSTSNLCYLDGQAFSSHSLSAPTSKESIRELEKEMAKNQKAYEKEAKKRAKAQAKAAEVHVPGFIATYKTPLLLSGVLAGGVGIAAFAGDGSRWDDDGSSTGGSAPSGGGDVTVYETTEFFGDVSALGGGYTQDMITPALDQINAQYAYAAGYTGNGVKIGIIDSGLDLDHPEFSGRVNSDLTNTNPAYDYDGQGTSADDPSHVSGDNTHGTNVASFAAATKDDTGMHGVAYNATIVPYKINTGDAFWCGLTDEAVIDGIGKGVFAFNMSFGYEASAAESAANTTESAVQLAFTYGTDYTTFSNAVANNEVLLIKAAGNDSYTEAGMMSAIALYDSAFATKFITVVAGNTTGDGLASFSNQCGVVKDTCIVAPGEYVMGAEDGGGYLRGNGTSFAAPMVTGAAAVIKEAFPHLTAAEVQNVLFTTATDMGAVGVDDVYGHGMLNLSAATSASSSGNSAFTASGNSVSFDGSKITLSSAFGNPDVGSVAFTDGMNRTFSIAGSSFTNEAEDAFDFIDASKSFAEVQKVQYSDLGGGFSSTMKMAKDDGKEYSDELSQIESMAFASQYTDDFGVSFAYTREPGADNNKNIETSSLMYTDANKHPFLNLASEGYTAGASYSFNDKWSLDTQSFFGTIRDDDYDNLGTSTTSMARIKYKGEGGDLGLEAGFMNEDSTVLGSKFEGAFALGGGNSTYFTGLTGNIDITDNLKAFANGYIGMTEVNTIANSLVSNVEDIISHSASAGLEYSFNPTKTAGLMFSQPLKVSSGSMDYNLATSRNVDGSYNYGSYSQDLSADATELDFQGYYKHQIALDTALNIGAIYRMNADNIEGEDETAMMVKLQHKF